MHFLHVVALVLSVVSVALATNATTASPTATTVTANATVPVRSSTSNSSEWTCVRNIDATKWVTARLTSDNHSVECVTNSSSSRACIIVNNKHQCPLPTGHVYSCSANSAAGEETKDCVWLYGLLIVGEELTLRNLMLFAFYACASWGLRLGVALGMVVVGLACASYGYYLLRALILILGVVIFSLAFGALVEFLIPEPTIKTIIWALAAIAFGVFCISLYGLAIFAKGAVAFATSALQVLDFIHIESRTTSYLIVIVAAIFGGIGSLKKERPFMIGCTAYFGATLVTYGTFYVLKVVPNMGESLFAPDVLTMDLAPYFAVGLTFVGAFIQFFWTAVDVYHHETEEERSERKAKAKEDAKGAMEDTPDYETVMEPIEEAKASCMTHWLSWPI